MVICERLPLTGTPATRRSAGHALTWAVRTAGPGTGQGLPRARRAARSATMIGVPSPKRPSPSYGGIMRRHKPGGDADPPGTRPNPDRARSEPRGSEIPAANEA